MIEAFAAGQVSPVVEWEVGQSMLKRRQRERQAPTEERILRVMADGEEWMPEEIAIQLRADTPSVGFLLKEMRKRGTVTSRRAHYDGLRVMLWRAAQ